MSKVLVVDDDAQVRGLLSLMLCDEGHTVLQSHDGVDGLATAIAERPDLIITDVSMPRLDGIEMVRQLKSSPGMDQSVILGLTANQAGHEEALLEAGARAVVAKPFAVPHLLQLVKSLLG